jgi:DhnA family fructose-bisphosphate aldolase class Ia
MSGAAMRLGRLFDKGSGRSFMVAFDRTLSMGPEPFAEDSAARIATITANGADAILSAARSRTSTSWPP